MSLRKCCCSVHIGTQILLILNFIFYIACFVALMTQQKKFNEKLRLENNAILRIYIALAILVSIELTALYGVLKEKRMLLIPHMISQILTLIPFIVLFFDSFERKIEQDQVLVIREEISRQSQRNSGLFWILLIVFQCYCFSIVYRYYKKLVLKNLHRGNLHSSS